MVVVNTKENLDPKILYLKFQKPVPSFLRLLDMFSAEGRHYGVKRNNYYLFTLDRVYALPRKLVSKEYNYFMSLAKEASNRYFTYIMFIL
jgi:hypothetical protein